MASSLAATNVAIDSRPLRHWSNASLELARTSIGRAWQDWCVRWQLTSGEVCAVNACDDATAATSQGEPWTAGKSLWLSAGDEDLAIALAGVLFEQGSRAGSPIAADVAIEAASDLSRSLAGLAVSRSGEASTALPAEPPVADLRRWSGALRVRLDADCDGRPLSLVLHCSETLATVLCGGMKPASSAGRPRLASVSDALAAKPLAFRVCLADTPVTLGALQSLRVGDVLPLSHRLDQPLRVLAPGTNPFCAAFLGRQEQHRAVELVSAAQDFSQIAP